MDEEFIKEVNNLQKINIGRDKGVKNYRAVDVDYKPNGTIVNKLFSIFRQKNF